MKQMITDSPVLCHNGAVSSFRDRLNPEAVLFPANIRSKVIIVCGALAILICAIPVYWIEQPLEPVLVDAAMMVAALIFLLAAWPDSLRTDQFGVSRHSIYPNRRLHIPWKDVASIELKKPCGGFLSILGVKSEMLVVYSSDGKRIVHGPRHPDRARFIHELGLHGVATEEATGEDAARQ